MKESIFEHMDFLERGSLPECMQLEEKKITRDEFNAAVTAASDYIVNDPEVEGMAKFMVPITGMMFAAKMEEILFGKEEG